MTWFLFAILGAFFDATYYVLVKKFLSDINEYVLASGIFLISALILFIIAIFNGIPQIDYRLFPSVLATGGLNVVAATLYYKSLKITDISLSIPMISFTPIFLIFTSFVVLGEFPTRLGIVGIFLIVLGSYILNLSKGGRNLVDPFKKMFTQKGILYMMVVAFLFSFTSNFDKLVVRYSDPVFGSALLWLFIGASFSVISMVKGYEIIKVYHQNITKLLYAALAISFVAISINIAYTMQIVPFVISVKRLSILFVVFYGGIIFKEESIMRRTIGALIMVLGVILITV